MACETSASASSRKALYAYDTVHAAPGRLVNRCMLGLEVCLELSRAQPAVGEARSAYNPHSAAELATPSTSLDCQQNSNVYG